MEIKKIECLTCKALHPDTLYPSDDQICVYCKADEAERVEEHVIEEVAEEQTPEETEQLKAQKELALRALDRKHMLPFDESFNPDDDPGWVDKDI